MFGTLNNAELDLKMGSHIAKAIHERQNGRFERADKKIELANQIGECLLSPDDWIVKEKKTVLIDIIRLEVKAYYHQPMVTYPKPKQNL